LPTWLIVVLAGMAAVVVLGLGVVLAINLLGGDPEPEFPLQVLATREEGVAEIQPTMTPGQPALEPTATMEAVPTVETDATATTEPSTTETVTETPASPQETQAIPSGAVLGGASGIAFASDRTGSPQIYYFDLASREVSQLTDLPNGACQPAWSPDGTLLAYTSPCGSNREAYTGSTIFMMQVDPAGNPGDIQPLLVSLGGGDYDPDWSPDGTRIAFTSQRTGRPQIFTVASDGQGLLNLNDDLAHNWSPSWSGDGSQLALLTGRGGAEEIWLVPSGGGEETRFSRSDGKDVAKPDWSPDSSTIIFEKVVGSIPRIVAAPVSEGGVRVVQVCQEGALSLQPMGEPAWSPDGTWLAFETWPGGGDHKIAIMQLSCTGYEELTKDPALDFDAAWRPAP
jgi:dipeptidyl aminopeptidase/acylaminoacyl peptidase